MSVLCLRPSWGQKRGQDQKQEASGSRVGLQSEQLAPSWGDRVSDSVLGGGGGEGQASRAAGAQKPPGGWHALGFLSDGQALPQKPLLAAQLMPGFLQNERAQQ